MDHGLGAAFATAVAAKDHTRIRELIHPEIDFWAMTPGEIWDAGGPDEIVGVLDEWFGEDDLIEAIELLDGDAFADRERVSRRPSRTDYLRLDLPGAPALASGLIHER